MSSITPTPSTPAAAPASIGKAKKAHPPARVLLVPYPKIVFLYPTFVTALVATIVTALNTDNRLVDQVTGITFVTVLLVNLVIFSFDFPRTTSLTLFFFFAALGLGTMLLFKFRPELFPLLADLLHYYSPTANAAMYASIAALLGGLLLLVQLTVRFDYWEVRPNELLHHHGLLSDMKRYSAPSVKIDKEINDLFEYVLMRSGRLILTIQDEPRAVVLDNVPFIERKEREITQLLGALQVQVRRT